MKENKPYYKRIYLDLIDRYYQNRKKYCLKILEKDELSFSDIMTLNKILFGEEM